MYCYFKNKIIIIIIIIIQLLWLYTFIVLTCSGLLAVGKHSNKINLTIILLLFSGNGYATFCEIMLSLTMG
jgi:hypothetical protein